MWTHTWAPAGNHKGIITTQSPCKPLLRPFTSPLQTKQTARVQSSFVLQASLREDPWRVLGVSPSANDQQIKKAYRKLALKHHPDVDPSDAAHERFLMIQEAYELVSGKRRGKESDHQHSSWEFHDWYWSFKRSKAKRSGRRAAAGAAPPPPPPPASNLNHQLSGLKQRAHTRKATSRSQRFAGAAVSSQPKPSAAAPPPPTPTPPTPTQTVQQHTSSAAPRRTDMAPPSIPRAPLHHVRVMLNTISDSHRCLARELHTVLVRRLELVLQLSSHVEDLEDGHHEDHQPTSTTTLSPHLDILQGPFAKYTHTHPPKGQSIASTDEGRQQVTSQLTGLRRKALLRRTASSVNNNTSGSIVSSSFLSKHVHHLTSPSPSSTQPSHPQQVAMLLAGTGTQLMRQEQHGLWVANLRARLPVVPRHARIHTTCIMAMTQQPSAANASSSQLLLSSTVMALRALVDTPHPLSSTQQATARLQLARASTQVVHMDAQQLIDVVWAAGKLARTGKLRGACRKTQDVAMLWYLSSVDTYPTTPTPLSLPHVTKLWSGLGMTRRTLAPQWQQLLEGAMLELIPTCSGYELAGIACAWGAAGMAPSQGVVNVHGQRVMALLDSMTGQDLAKIMWAWASINTFPTTISFDTISDRALGMLDTCTTWELSIMLFAHARVRHAPDDVVGYLVAQRLYQGFDDLGYKAVPGLMVSVAKLGMQLPPSLTVDCLTAVAAHASGRQVAQCVWAACVMYAGQPETLQAVVPALQRAIKGVARSFQLKGKGRGGVGNAKGVGNARGGKEGVRGKQKGVAQDGGDGGRNDDGMKNGVGTGDMVVGAEEASLLLQCDAAVRCLAGRRSDKGSGGIATSMLAAAQYDALSLGSGGGGGGNGGGNGNRTVQRVRGGVSNGGGSGNADVVVGQQALTTTSTTTTSLRSTTQNGLLDPALTRACWTALAINPPRPRQGLADARQRLAAAAAMLPGVQWVGVARPVLGGVFTVDVVVGYGKQQGKDGGDERGGVEKEGVLYPQQQPAPQSPSSSSSSQTQQQQLSSSPQTQQRVAFDLQVPEQCFANVPTRPLGHRVLRSTLIRCEEGMPVVGVPLEVVEGAESVGALAGVLQRMVVAQDGGGVL